jgi:hypothetical protein
MPSIIDIYKKSIPTTGKANTSGTDKTIIEDKKSDDKTIDKARHGVLGNLTGGYDPKTPYSSTVKK